MDSVQLAANLVLAFLVTYLVHSTLLLGGAWALGRALRERFLPLQDLAWKVALVGGFVTAGARVAVQALERPAALAPVSLSAADLAVLRAAGESAGPHPGIVSLAGQLAGWERLVLVVWGLGAVLGALALARSWQRLRRCLASRRVVDRGPLREMLDELLARSARRETVRLCDAPALPVPVARGVLAPEICLPTRVAADLGTNARAAVLAHELAHVVRRDPAWLLVARGIESVFFLQPLNRVARIRLQSLSEYLADAWALETTGDEKGLAQCLVEVAGWLRPPAALLAPGMAGSRGQLKARIERILAAGGESVTSPVRPWAKAAIGTGLLATAVFAPAMAAPALLDPAPAVAPAGVAVEPAMAPAVEPPDEEAIADGVEEALVDAVPEGIEDALDESMADALERVDEATLGAIDEATLGALAALSEEPWHESLAELDALAAVDLAELAPAFDLVLDPKLLAELDGTLMREVPGVALALADEPVIFVEPPPAVEIERLEELAREIAGRRQLTREEVERLREAAQSLADRQRLSREEVERLEVAARELAERHRPSREQLEKLREEVRRNVARARPSRETLERLRAEARELAEKHRPSPEMLEKLRAEARAEARKHRPSERELEAIRRQAREQREQHREKALVLRERNRQERRAVGAEARARALAEAEQRLEAELARIRELRAEAERQRAEPSEAPEPPR